MARDQRGRESDEFLGSAEMRAAQSQQCRQVTATYLSSLGHLPDLYTESGDGPWLFGVWQVFSLRSKGTPTEGGRSQEGWFMVSLWECGLELPHILYQLNQANFRRRSKESLPSGESPQSCHCFYAKIGTALIPELDFPRIPILTVRLDAPGLPWGDSAVGRLGGTTPTGVDHSSIWPRMSSSTHCSRTGIRRAFYTKVGGAGTGAVRWMTQI